MIKPFENGERICFIGDSITALTSWISHVADFYAGNVPGKDISIFPCGVSGGTCESAMTYYRQQTAIWSPTVAVIMLGMNDIDRELYGESATAESLEKAEQTIKRYELNLSLLSDMIKSESSVDRIIYLAPTPYDEQQVTDTKNLKGCWKALRKCAEICKKTAEAYGGEYYDFGGEVYRILCQARQQGTDNELVSKDRVHPTELGFCVMARVFLTAQGFEQMAVSGEDVVSGKAMLYRSTEAELYYNAAATLQDRWTAEWLIARFSPDQSRQGKIAYAGEFAEKMKDSEFFRTRAENYEKYILEEKVYRENFEKALIALKKKGISQ